MSAQESPIWTKELWRKQPFDDDYVPPSYGETSRVPGPDPTNILQSNGWVIHRDALRAISRVCIIMGVYCGLLLGSWGSTEVILVFCFLFLIQRGRKSIHSFFERATTSAGVTEASKLGTELTIGRQTLLPAIIMYLLAPLSLSLTRATTSDTIWPLACTLFGLSFLVEERGTANVAEGAAPVARLGTCLATSLRLSGCIVLASRLEAVPDVFAFMLVASALVER